LPPPDQACDALGDALARHLPRPPEACDAATAAFLERALAASGRSEPAPRRARFFWPALAGVAVAGAVALVLVRLPVSRGNVLGYEVVSGAPAAGGRIETKAGHEALLKFSDGSSVVLGGRSAGQIRARTAAGATFALEHGRATFSVVHRPGTSWLVEAGPFQIAVTGTRFDVRWGEEPGGLEVKMLEGTVMVRGALAGRGVALHAGQRLAANPARAFLMVGPDEERAPLPAAAPALAPPPAPQQPPPATAVATHVAGGERGERRARRHAPTAEAPAEGPPPGEDEAEAAIGGPRRELLMNAGGDLCKSFVPQFGFEKWTEGFTVATRELVALRRSSLDHTHSWCGNGSLKLDAEFNPSGPPNALGTLPYKTGQVTVRLGKPVDLTGKLVVAHVYVEAPERVQLGMQVFAIDHAQRKTVAGGVEQHIAAGRWWTVRASFEEPGKGARSPLAHVDGLAFQIYDMGGQRTWNGTVYIDDVGWK
jgi:hypothetical protein